MVGVRRETRSEITPNLVISWLAISRRQQLHSIVAAESVALYRLRLSVSLRFCRARLSPSGPRVSTPAFRPFVRLRDRDFRDDNLSGRLSGPAAGANPA